MVTIKRRFRVQHSGHLYRWCSCDHACLRSVCFASWLNLKLTRSTTWKQYAIIACNRRFWKTITYGIYIYADFGKDKNTNNNDLLTHSISLQLYSVRGVFDFKMLDLHYIANNPLCNMSTKNRTDIRPFPFKKMRCETSSSAKLEVGSLLTVSICVKTVLTLKHPETHGCVISTVATDALVLTHQAISILSTD